MNSRPLTDFDPKFSSVYLIYEDGTIVNTNTRKTLKMDSKDRVSLVHADYDRPVHRSIRKLYKGVFDRYYHGVDNTIDLPNEEWIEIEKSKGGYYISNFGRIKSYINHSNPRILNPYIRKKDSPYFSIDLFIDGNRSIYLVHRLVAKHFKDNYDESKVIHHKDGNPLNNNVENLECLTKEEHIKLHNAKKDDTNDTI